MQQRSAIAACLGFTAAMLGSAGAMVPRMEADAETHAGLPMHLAQISDKPSDKLGPYLAVRAMVVAAPASQAPLLIRVVPAERAPSDSFVRVRGLPPAAGLSAGKPVTAGVWEVPLDRLPDLMLGLPQSASGRSELVVSLIGADGLPLAHASIALLVQPPSVPAASAEKSPRPLPSPPSGAPPPPLATERANAEKLMARGDREVEQGNIVVARQFYLRAAQMGLARAALMLAATYDPHELARMRVVGIVPNVAEARKWYERALELGAPEATERLADLVGGR